MELNRNQFFMVGVVVLVLGIQFKLVDRFVLNEASSKIVEKRIAKNKQARGEAADVDLPALSIDGVAGKPRHEWKPPKWIGWALLSAGAVLILHSLAMKRPE